MDSNAEPRRYVDRHPPITITGWARTSAIPRVGDPLPDVPDYRVVRLRVQQVEDDFWSVEVEGSYAPDPR